MPSPIRQSEMPQSAWEHVLPFERPLAELHGQIVEADSAAERETLEKYLAEERARIFAELTPWARVQLARHPLRPRMLNYVEVVLDDLVELHGDRLNGDDPAVIGGIGRFQGETVMVVGQEKGVTTEQRVSRNFGLAHPEGYRKALRLFKMAERLGLPVITFVDTQAAHPGIEAEEGGQGPAIAENLLAMAKLESPIFSVVIGEGGSGGALGIAMGDYVCMMENAIYVVCPPERCAEILWRDGERKELAASAMRITAHDLKELGVIDEIIFEPNGGAHRDSAGAMANLSDAIERFLHGCKAGEWTPAKRQAKFQRIGVWHTAEIHVESQSESATD